MPDKLWIYDGKLVINATGNPVLTPACPCNWQYDSCTIALDEYSWQYDSCSWDITP